MPFKGFTWFRLKEHFRKTIAIYIVGIIIMALLSNLLYTTTAPQTPPEQEVLVYMVSGYSNPDPLAPVAADGLAYGQTIDETLLEVEFIPLNFSDPAVDYTGPMVAMARMSVGDGDAYICNDHGLDYMIESEIGIYLEDYLADGWLSAIDGEPYVYTSQENGETHTFAIGLDNVDALQEMGAFANEGAYLIIAGNGTNIETTMATVEYMLTQLVEGTYASGNIEEPAA